MTKETRIMFGLEDLVTIRVQCGKCQGEMVQRLDGHHWYLPGLCPMCHVSWDQEVVDRDGIDELIVLIRRLSRGTDPKLNVRFELDGAVAESESENGGSKA